MGIALPALDGKVDFVGWGSGEAGGDGEGRGMRSVCFGGYARGSGMEWKVTGMKI